MNFETRGQRLKNGQTICRMLLYFKMIVLVGDLIAVHHTSSIFILPFDCDLLNATRRSAPQKATVMRV